MGGGAGQSQQLKQLDHYQADTMEKGAIGLGRSLVENPLELGQIKEGWAIILKVECSRLGLHPKRGEKLPLKWHPEHLEPKIGQIF